MYECSQQALGRARETPSLVDARTDYSNASPEVQVAVDRAKAADLGVRMATVDNTLRLMVAGDDEISNDRESGERYPVKIRFQEDQRRDIDKVGTLTVSSLSGGPVRIDNVAQLQRGFGPTRITWTTLRHRPQRRRCTRARAGDVRRLVSDLHMPPGYSLQMQGQTRNLDETTTNLIMAIGLASIVVYMVLAAQFESLVQPLIIMAVPPLPLDACPPAADGELTGRRRHRATRATRRRITSKVAVSFPRW